MTNYTNLLCLIVWRGGEGSEMNKEAFIATITDIKL